VDGHGPDGHLNARTAGHGHPWGHHRGRIRTRLDTGSGQRPSRIPKVSTLQITPFYFMTGALGV
jgi:hypothetical protein